MVWRLHEDIPHKVAVRPAPRIPATKRSAPEEEPVEQPVEDVQEVREEDFPALPPTNINRRVPAGSWIPWSPLEERLIPLGDPKPHKAAYELYAQECEKHGLPVRTLKAF